MQMKLIFLILLIVFTSPTVLADNSFFSDTVNTISESANTETLDSASSAGFSFSGTMNSFIDGSHFDIKRFFSSFADIFFKETKSNVSLALKLIIVAVCSCIIQLFTKDTSGYLPDISFYVCYMVIFLFCMSSLDFVSSVCKNAIESMLFFMQSAIPVLGSVLAGSGKNITVTSLCFSIAVICGACNILSQILLPLGKMCAVAGGISGLGVNLNTLSASVKRIVLWALGLLTTVLGIFISMQNFAASASDNIAIKTAKFTAGSVIPVIGGTVSDTLESVFACGTLVKNAAGGASVIALLYICLSPVLKILAVILAYRFVSVIVSPFSDSRIVTAINGFIDSLYIFLAFVITSCILFIICAGIVCKI